MTIGLTWRRTARRIKRLKEGVLTISPDYSDRPTPDFLALSERDGAPKFWTVDAHNTKTGMSYSLGSFNTLEEAVAFLESTKAPSSEK
jgi:hypothetical protein